jgi:hypothetical protein
MSLPLAVLLSTVCAALLATLWLAFRRRSECARRLQRAIESAGYEVVHGANAARAHLIAMELEARELACAAHLAEVRRALERIERAAAILAEALRPESAASPGSNSAGAPPDPA